MVCDASASFKLRFRCWSFDMNVTLLHQNDKLSIIMAWHLKSRLLYHSSNAFTLLVSNLSLLLTQHKESKNKIVNLKTQQNFTANLFPKVFLGPEKNKCTTLSIEGDKEYGFCLDQFFYFYHITLSALWSSLNGLDRRDNSHCFSVGGLDNLVLNTWLLKSSEKK